MLAVKHNASDGMMLSVAKSDEGQYHRTLGCEFLRWPGKYEKRFVARIFADADVAPTHRFCRWYWMALKYFSNHSAQRVTRRTLKYLKIRASS